MFNLLKRTAFGPAASFLSGAPDEVLGKFGGLDVDTLPVSQQEGQFDLTLEIVDND